MSQVAFIGEGSLLIRCALATENDGHTISYIASSNQEILHWAQNRGIQVFTSCDGVPAELLATPDFTFSIGHLQVIPTSILDHIRGQIINFHDGPLPEYAGLHVTSWAILNGENTHAVCWHEVTGEIDGGDLVATASFPVQNEETALSLNLVCFEQGARLFSEIILPQLTPGKLKTMPQESAPRTLYTRHQKPTAGGVLCWNDPVEKISRTVRALTFGSYDNPLVSSKILIEDLIYVVPAIAETNWQADCLPGTIVSTDGALSISCADGVVEISELLTPHGEKVSIAAVKERHALTPGCRLAVLDEAQALAFQAQLVEASRFEAGFMTQFSSDTIGLVDGISGNESSQNDYQVEEWQDIPGGQPSEMLQAVLAYFALEQEQHSGCFGVGNRNPAELGPLVNPVSPQIIRVDPEESFQTFFARYKTFHNLPADLAARRRVVKESPPAIFIVSSPEFIEHCTDAKLIVELAGDTASYRIHSLSDVVSSTAALRISGELQTFLAALFANPSVALKTTNLLNTQADNWMRGFNNTAVPVEYGSGVHELFSAIAHEAGDSTALQFRSEQISYAALDTRSNQIAALLHSHGVQEGMCVGIYLNRSIDMVAAVLGVLKTGAAYVPLDPAFPEMRLRQMVEDAALSCIISDEKGKQSWENNTVPILSLESDLTEYESPCAAGLLERNPDALAYVMFTSGSTGRPKGVKITHKNLLNFFTGIDSRIGKSAEGTWLAVTSLSFDISVLELLWSLCRGLRVILFDHADGIAPGSRSTETSLDFSLSYFASETSEFSAADGYALLYAGVEFADKNNFLAVWTPERHFHNFGGLFPNPAVTSAALAARTEALAIRAGSVVAPLHHPVRIAEDWALVDQLSNGRAGVSFASGWQENDFVLRPEAYARRKEEMFTTLESVRKLWRGETVSFTGVDGKTVPVAIKPLPVNPELPVWITAAGNPETFRLAGESGANVLTHLLGQSIADLASKIRIYREARKQAGYETKGQVTVMVHTFVGHDRASVRAAVYKPLTNYLQSAVGLIREAPYAFPTFKKPSAAIAAKVEQGVRDFTTQEIEQLTDFAFERYFESSGLFGTPAECVERACELHAVGADELACLIDFGVPHAAVLDSLPLLNQVREATQRALQGQRYSLAELLARETITYFQCTPSFMELIADVPEALNGLSRIDTIMLGGEPLKTTLLERIRPAITGRLFNMYGPTETTIWSSICDVRAANWEPVLGEPIANTGIYIVDVLGRLVPPGKTGELYITGAGLAAGYIGKPELTNERFVTLQTPAGEQRAYRTGDYGRIHPDGRFEFAGRTDGQVKVSGHRIELTEVERALGSIATVDQCVVVLSTLNDTAILKAYYRSAQDFSAQSLREKLGECLPAYMIPAQFVRLDALPLTPNGKVDRVSLAARVEETEPITVSAKNSTVLETVQSVWASILLDSDLNIDTNIFDLGANSLMVVQAAVQLREILQKDIPLVDVFRNPTIRAFVASLEAEPVKDTVEKSPERASKRRTFLSRRQGRRQEQ